MPAGFTIGDPRARAAGRKGGSTMRAKQTPDYIAGYKAGARTTTRRYQELAMRTPERPASSAFLRHALRLHVDQLKAVTPSARDSADAALAHFFRMAEAGRLDEWIASHATDYDDSMATNPEDAL